MEGERGRLSRATVDLLNNGAVIGERNGSVYKAARDFLQNLYDQTEAEERIMRALEYNNVFDSDFTPREARTTIRSAFHRPAKHKPRY